MKKYDLVKAHKASSFNRDTLSHDSECGCFHCLRIFQPSEIVEWCCEAEDGEEVTAICPHCGVDSVIGGGAGFPITKDFLRQMQEKWFGPYDCL